MLGWIENRTAPKDDNRCNNVAVCLEGDLVKVTVEGESKFVSGSNLIVKVRKQVDKWCRRTCFGTLCLGQGTRPNNCGQDRTKLNIWGMKKSKSVLEKWA